MGAVTAPTTPLRPRPAWREPRFLLGLLLVVISVAGVLALVAAADRTEQAFAVRHAVAAGDQLGMHDVRAVRVRLGGADAAYLTSAPPPGTVVTHTIGRGELVPLAALAAASTLQATSVVIAVDRALPAAVEAGASVDVWAAAANDAGAGAARFEAPQVLVPGATVVRVDRDTTLGAGGNVAVEVRVPKSAAAGLLAAISNRAAITLLPAGG